MMHAPASSNGDSVSAVAADDEDAVAAEVAKSVVVSFISGCSSSISLCSYI